MNHDERQRRMMESSDAYAKAMHDLPIADSQFVTLLHLWNYARRQIHDEQYHMMILRPLAYMHLKQEGCPSKEIQGRLAQRMEDLYRFFLMQERKREIGDETGTIIPFSRPH